ncbi:MAG: NUDIX domain-containing protein [Alphaproteobacteria bacterium]|nr:MAG: NUDIX domain-containing protein [Alphaproteobacteria bacterium]
MPDVFVNVHGLTYRRGTGVLIFRQGEYMPELLVGLRANACPPSWQTPQGGLEAGLAHEANAYKEAKEEVGLLPRELYFVGLTPTETMYTLPDDKRGRGFAGQVHRWAVLRYIGEPELPDLIQATDREFSSLRWAPPMWVIANTSDFRVEPYQIAIPEALAMVKALGRTAVDA